eukprot:Gb_27966 [translate_table: standard]
MKGTTVWEISWCVWERKQVTGFESWPWMKKEIPRRLRKSMGCDKVAPVGGHETMRLETVSIGESSQMGAAQVSTRNAGVRRCLQVRTPGRNTPGNRRIHNTEAASLEQGKKCTSRRRLKDSDKMPIKGDITAIRRYTRIMANMTREPLANCDEPQQQDALLSIEIQRNSSLEGINYISGGDLPRNSSLRPDITGNDIRKTNFISKDCGSTTDLVVSSCDNYFDGGMSGSVIDSTYLVHVQGLGKTNKELRSKDSTHSVKLDSRDYSQTSDCLCQGGTMVFSLLRYTCYLHLRCQVLTLSLKMIHKFLNEGKDVWTQKHSSMPNFWAQEKECAVLQDATYP